MELLQVLKKIGAKLLTCIATVDTRVARWHIFKQNPDLGKFWRVLQWKMLVIICTAIWFFTAIWYSLWLFCLFYIWLFGIFFLILVCCTKIIWLPWLILRWLAKCEPRINCLQCICIPMHTLFINHPGANPLPTAGNFYCGQNWNHIFLTAWPVLGSKVRNVELRYKTN
jgi:hypothetical protein